MKLLLRQQNDKKLLAKEDEFVFPKDLQSVSFQLYGRLFLAGEVGEEGKKAGGEYFLKQICFPRKKVFFAFLKSHVLIFRTLVFLFSCFSISFISHVSFFCFLIMQYRMLQVGKPVPLFQL